MILKGGLEMKTFLMLIVIVLSASCGTLTEPHYYQDNAGKCWVANLARGDENNSFRYIGVEWEPIPCDEIPAEEGEK